MPRRRSDDPRELQKRIERRLRKSTPQKLSPKSKLARIYEELRERAVQEWAESQRQRALAGLPAQPPPEVRSRQEVRRIPLEAFVTLLSERGPEISQAVASVLLDAEVRAAYEDWIGDADHPILAFFAVTEDPLTAWYGDIILGANPDPNLLKHYVLTHAADLRKTLAERAPAEREAELQATLSRPEAERPLPFRVTTAEGEEIAVEPHRHRGPVTLEPGQWRGLPTGIGEDPHLYSTFPAPDDPRFWKYAESVKRKEERRAEERAQVYRQAVAEVSGDPKRAGYWKRVYARMMQLADELYRNRRKRIRREAFGGRGPRGTYHAGHRTKRRRRR